MPLTVSEYKKLLAEHGSLAAVARYLNRDVRNLRRWVKRNVEPPVKNELPKDDPEILLTYLRKPRTITELAECVDRSPKTVHSWLEELVSLGYNIRQTNDLWSLDRIVLPAESQINHETDEIHLTIGVVSDTHLCSKYQQLTFLNEFYDICVEKGISSVYHAGDLMAGVGVYAGQDSEIFRHTEDDQIQYVIDNYPRRSGVQTYFIGGNHDLVFVKRNGSDPGYRISLERDDMHYLGPFSAWVKLTEGCQLYLLHPDGGGAYARSYKPQKLAESFMGGKKPNIAVIGHYHSQLYMKERNIHLILPGSFESQTPYLRRKMVQPQVCGVILHIDFYRDGSVQAVTPTFVSYLIPKECDY